MLVSLDMACSLVLVSLPWLGVDFGSRYPSKASFGAVFEAHFSA